MTGSSGSAGGGRTFGITANVHRANNPDVPDDPGLWWWRGQSWPHVDPSISRTEAPDPARALRLHEYYNLNIGGAWSDAHWGPYPYARSLLPEFSQAILPWAPVDGPPQSLGFPTLASGVFDFDAVSAADAPLEPLDAWPATTAQGMTVLDQELIELVGLMEYRPGVLAEALEQAVSIDQCFSGIITFNRITHPNTAKLTAFAIEAGTHIAMLFKAYYNRPRPSQLCPTLLPPIDPPEHGAFPSGHATQAWLTALLLDSAMGGKLDPQPVTGVTFSGTRTNPLFDMARRIARNREILGLHYPSDSEAGRRLAHAAYATIVRQDCGRIRDLMTAARHEWGNGPLPVPGTGRPEAPSEEEV